MVALLGTISLATLHQRPLGAAAGAHGRFCHTMMLFPRIHLDLVARLCIFRRIHLSINHKAETKSTWEILC